jgi:hypothetical protein
MKCDTAQQVFSDYLEETIERPLALTFEHHLSQCDECQRAYGDFRSTWRVLESFPVMEAPSGFRESLISRVQAQQDAKSQAADVRRFSLRSVFGARVPIRAFAWAMSVLILAVLLVNVSPGVFQSTLTGPLGGSYPLAGSWVMPAGPGMEVGVRTQEVGTEADVYQIVFKPSSGAGQVEARICSIESGKELCKAQVFSGREMVVPVLVKQPQARPTGVDVTWSYNGRSYSRYIFLPRSLAVSELPYFRSWKGDVHGALSQIASGYGVVVSADAGLEGSVGLSGRYENAKAALDQVADELGLQVRKEGSRAYRVEPK